MNRTRPGCQMIARSISTTTGRSQIEVAGVAQIQVGLNGTYNDKRSPANSTAMAVNDTGANHLNRHPGRIVLPLLCQLAVRNLLPE